MGRKSKYSKEIKISIVKRYLSGEASTCYLEKETGIHGNIISRWIKKYKENGGAAFDTKKQNQSYTKGFKEPTELVKKKVSFIIS